MRQPCWCLRVSMGEDTLGIEYTNDPRALREEPEDGSVVVRKTIVDVFRGVICIWRVVCGERGRGTESCLGWGVGIAEVTAAAAVGSGGDCAMDGASEDADIMRGISGVRIPVLKSFPTEMCFECEASFTDFSPTLLGGRDYFLSPAPSLSSICPS